MSRIPERVLRYLAWGAAGLGAVASVAFVVASIARRPYNAVETELLFESVRVARGLSLYVDPRAGAWEDGAPASRYYVLYTAVWPWVVGHLAHPSVASAREVGRLLSVAAWSFLQIAPVVLALRANRSRVALASLIVTGLYFLSRNAPVGTPDTLAAALACAGLLRAARKGRVDALSAALLVAAPFVKPSCLGVFAGATVATFAERPRGWKRAVVGGLVAFAVIAAACHVVSGGAWLVHMTRSTGQPLLFHRWVEQVGTRFLVLGLPHLVVLAFALRRRAQWIIVGPLALSLAWSTFSMAKDGSGTHYWLEPTMAALVAIAFMPRAPEIARARAAEREARPSSSGLLWAGAAVLAGTVCATGLVAFAHEAEGWAAHDAEMAALDQHCSRATGDVVASTEVEVELALNGRLLVPEWQSSFLAHSQRFPVDAWRADVDDPHVRWLVLGAAVPSGSDDSSYVSVFDRELRGVVQRDFAFDGVVARRRVYRRVGLLGVR